ncbi:helix-turn-helix domain-containing protein [Sphingobium sp. DC-2]|uniref:helix-turn-helix domain-containing protein n=1 Tax=Sphingobium sp. DC-2 TaxID=1303256 RepID=UPI0004C3EA17|nr:helix-turn-helix domain-containing protein [Sphingobium sp. DC-2]
MMIDMTATATMIKSLRRDHGLTQEDLAARAGCGLATIQRAEAGKPLSAATIASIAAAFDIPASDLAAPAETHFEPYLPLEPITSGRILVALLLGIRRIDFDFCEVASLSDAEAIQAFHDLCYAIAGLETPLPPLARVTHDIEARDQLTKLSARGLCVGAAYFDITAYEVDDDCGGGPAILYGQWDERRAAIRIGRAPDEIARAHILRGLGQWEQVKTGALVEPPREELEIDWSGIFGASPEKQGKA